MKYLAVKNWPRFQHYKDRSPPWIKLYVALLDDLEFLELSDTEQISLLKLWMLAARLGHPLPNNPKLLQERAGVRPKALAALIAHGWLELTNLASNPASNGDSTPLAEMEHSASPRARPRVPARASARSREGEGEGERESSSAAPRARLDVIGVGVVDNLPAGPARSAYTAYRKAHRFPEGLDTALGDIAEPINGGPAYDWPTIGLALIEMRAAQADFTPATVRGFCRRIVQANVPTNGNERHSARRTRNLEVLAQHAAGGNRGE